MPELKRYVLTSVVVKNGHLETYWIEDKGLATPFFDRTIARNHFELINGFLHFNNNEANLSAVRINFTK